MLTATIHIDDKAYQGEDLNNTYATNIGGSGWHVGNHGELDILLIGEGDPKVLYGIRGVKSDLEKILQRIKDGQIVARKIVIELSED